jgi:hypothetical protein
LVSTHRRRSGDQRVSNGEEDRRVRRENVVPG